VGNLLTSSPSLAGKFPLAMRMSPFHRTFTFLQRGQTIGRESSLIFYIRPPPMTIVNGSSFDSFPLRSLGIAGSIPQL
jgi:hypothetical protein